MSRARSASRNLWKGGGGVGSCGTRLVRLEGQNCGRRSTAGTGTGNEGFSERSRGSEQIWASKGQQTGPVLVGTAEHILKMKNNCDKRIATAKRGKGPSPRAANCGLRTTPLARPAPGTEIGPLEPRASIRDAPAGRASWRCRKARIHDARETRMFDTSRHARRARPSAWKHSCGAGSLP